MNLKVRSKAARSVERPSSNLSHVVDDKEALELPAVPKGVKKPTAVSFFAISSLLLNLTFKNRQSAKSYLISIEFFKAAESSRLT